MINDVVIQNLRYIIEYLSILFLFSYLAFNRYGRGVNQYPGPFLASISSLWAVWYIWRTPHDIPFRALHERYGPIVRLSPRRLIFAQPEAVQDIYGTKGLRQKSDMHKAAQATVNGIRIDELFTSTNMEWHNSFRRRVNNAFSMSSIVSYETYVASTIADFIQQLNKRAKVKNTLTVDFPIWLHFFADDAVSSKSFPLTGLQDTNITLTDLTYGDSLGHMKAGEDIGGALQMMKKILLYTIYVMQMPVLDEMLWKNPILMWFNKRGMLNGHGNTTAGFVFKAQAARQELRQRIKTQPALEEITHPALMDRFLEAQEQNPDIIGPLELLALGVSVFGAGSETT